LFVPGGTLRLQLLALAVAATLAITNHSLPASAQAAAAQLSAVSRVFGK
jgi:hypothetical protein